MRAEQVLAGFTIEVLWAVYCMMEVLQGHADSICMEPLDYASSDLRLNYGDERHYHEIKLNLPWPLFVNKYSGNLFNFLRGQRKGEAYCTIVSLHPIEHLSELISLAKITDGYDDFNEKILQNDLQLKRFAQLLPQSEKSEDIYQALKHLDFKIIGDHLDKSTESRIELLIDGDPERAKLVLINYASRTAGSELTADDIWLYLETAGFHPRRLAGTKISRKRLIRIGEIQEFYEVNKFSRRDITPKILSQVRCLDEKEEIEPFLREILHDFTETPHTSTEIADILTPHITYSGRAHLTAFVNKGKSYLKVTSKQVAHQIMRLKIIELLDFIVLLAVGDIQDDIKTDVTYMAEQKDADYMIVDAIDIARLFIAYGKLCPHDGTPYKNNKCPSCGILKHH